MNTVGDETGPEGGVADIPEKKPEEKYLVVQRKPELVPKADTQTSYL